LFSFYIKYPPGAIKKLFSRERKVKKIISIIGPNTENCSKEICDFGEKLGAAIVENGYILACGGSFGIMQAVCKGAKNSPKSHFGCTIGILPELDKKKANPYCDIVIPTGIGYARNQIVVNTGDVVVAIAGGSGTLSEIAFAWQFAKKIICYQGFGGWSEKLAGIDLDNRNSGLIKTARSLEEIISFTKEAF